MNTTGKTTKKLILEALLHTEATQDGGKGICYSVETYLHSLGGDYPIRVHTYDCFDCFMDYLSKQWVYYSGSIAFPVPSDNEFDGVDRFFVAVETKSLWQGEYGNKRKQLLQFLIDNIDVMNDDGSINNQHVIKQENI